jgi:hypothetical protein
LANLRRDQARYRIVCLIARGVRQCAVSLMKSPATMCDDGEDGFVVHVTAIEGLHTVRTMLGGASVG